MTGWKASASAAPVPGQLGNKGQHPVVGAGVHRRLAVLAGSGQVKVEQGAAAGALGRERASGNGRGRRPGPLEGRVLGPLLDLLVASHHPTAAVIDVIIGAGGHDPDGDRVVALVVVAADDGQVSSPSRVNAPCSSGRCRPTGPTRPASSCSSTGRRPPTRGSSSRKATRPPWRRSALAWTACP